MFAGHIVESGRDPRDVLARPKHPYTQLLLAAGAGPAGAAGRRRPRPTRANRRGSSTRPRAAGSAGGARTRIDTCATVTPPAAPDGCRPHGRVPRRRTRMTLRCRAAPDRPRGPGSPMAGPSSAGPRAGPVRDRRSPPSAAPGVTEVRDRKSTAATPRPRWSSASTDGQPPRPYAWSRVCGPRSTALPAGATPWSRFVNEARRIASVAPEARRGQRGVLLGQRRSPVRARGSRRRETRRRDTGRDHRRAQRHPRPSSAPVPPRPWGIAVVFRCRAINAGRCRPRRAHRGLPRFRWTSPATSAADRTSPSPDLGAAMRGAGMAAGPV